MLMTVPVKTTPDLWNAWSGVVAAQEQACTGLTSIVSDIKKTRITACARLLMNHCISPLLQVGSLDIMHIQGTFAATTYSGQVHFDPS